MNRQQLEVRESVVTANPAGQVRVLHTAIDAHRVRSGFIGDCGVLGMENRNEDWMRAVTDALSELLAARVAQATLLEALLVSHPDPVTLRKAWDELSSQRIAYVAQQKAVADDPRPMDSYTLAQFHAWDEKLKRYFPRDLDVDDEQG